MSKDISLHEPVNTLDVESVKDSKKRSSQQADNTLNSSNDPQGNPLASSTLNFDKKSSLKEPTSTLVTETFLNKNRLPRIPICATRYIPMLYTFRVPSYNANSINMGKAQRPPFYLLLDNAIAVVWCLFSKDTCPKPLGICQLQWALSFLDGIKNRRGERPKDVDICVNVIYDQLIQLYGELVNELETFQRPRAKKQKPKKKSDKEVVDETEGSHKSPDGSHKSADVSHKSAERSSKTPDSLSLSDRNVGDLPLTESYLERIVGSMPFSVNYNDIVNASQKSTSKAYGLDASKSGRSMNTQSREQLVSFLSSWKQEQIDKIQSELQRLHSIENFIGNCEKGNFPNNMGDKELTVLLEEKNKRRSSI